MRAHEIPAVLARAVWNPTQFVWPPSDSTCLMFCIVSQGFLFLQRQTSMFNRSSFLLPFCSTHVFVGWWLCRFLATIGNFVFQKHGDECWFDIHDLLTPIFYHICSDQKTSVSDIIDRLVCEKLSWARFTIPLFCKSLLLSTALTVH